MPSSLSNTTVSSITIRPLSGFSIPAILLRVRLLPHPELPKSPVTSSAHSSLTARVKSPNFFTMSTYNRTNPFLSQAYLLLDQ